MQNIPRDEMRTGEWRGHLVTFASKLEQIEQIGGSLHKHLRIMTKECQ